MNRLEGTFKIAAGAVFALSSFGAVSNLIEARNLEDQMRQNPAYLHSLTLDDADKHLTDAEYSLNKRKEAIAEIHYPNGITARANIDSAVSDLAKEPSLVQALKGIEDIIPQEADIRTFNNQSVDNSTFQKEREQIEAVRKEIAALSANNKADVRLSLDEKTAAEVRLALLVLGGMEFASIALWQVGDIMGEDRSLDPFLR